MSVQAIGAAELDLKNVKGLDDIANLSPAVTLDAGGPGNSTFYIRGVSDGGFGNPSGAASTTALYLDEQPLTTIGQTPDLHVFDVERVEILSGPQGTLYGSSSTSGNIKIITMNRTIRKESICFSILYEIHLLITFLITFKYIRFGNFSFLNKKIINVIAKKKELWLAYSATLNKYFNSKSFISAPRKKRISGKSKMSYTALISHSLNIQTVFIKNIFLSYIIYSIFFIFLFIINLFKLIAILFLILLFAHFLIILSRLKEKNNEVSFNLCLKNIKSVKKIN